jgi:hypothetical protein
MTIDFSALEFPFLHYLLLIRIANRKCRNSGEFRYGRNASETVAGAVRHDFLIKNALDTFLHIRYHPQLTSPSQSFSTPIGRRRQDAFCGVVYWSARRLDP